MDAAMMTVPEFRTFYDGWSRTEKEYLGEIRDKLKAVAEAGQRPPQVCQIIFTMICYARFFARFFAPELFL